MGTSPGSPHVPEILAFMGAVADAAEVVTGPGFVCTVSST